MKRLWTSPEDIIDMTLSWTGDRSADGRPRVSDAQLDALTSVSHSQAWDILQARGYDATFAGGWKQTRPDDVLVGRAVTTQFLPYRPDFDGATLVAASLGDGDPPWGTPSEWAVSSLGPGDVMVVDVFGKVRRGTVLGQRLAASVLSRTGRGAVIDGGIRHSRQIEKLDGCFFYRDSDAATLDGVSLAAINGPVRIGPCTVLPGDVIIGDSSGLTFIPPHLVDEVITKSRERQQDAPALPAPAGTGAAATDRLQGEFAAWRRASGFSDD